MLSGRIIASALMMPARFVALVLIGGIALGAVPAAADQLLTGKRLSITK